MYRAIIVILVVILTFGNLAQIDGFKWVALKSGDPVPEDALRLDSGSSAYVGRARHFNLLLPAEVYNRTVSYAIVSNCNKQIVKHQFEVLLATEPCEWQNWNRERVNIPENIVRGGTEWNDEPIFIGKSIPSYYNNDVPHIGSLLLSSNQFKFWTNQDRDTHPYLLICNITNNWVDTPSDRLPNNTISGGQSEDDHEMFVARLLHGCQIVPGQVIPDFGFATALYAGDYLEAYYCQVLVGDTNEHSWVPAKNGEIPDHAVVSAKYTGGDLQYVARFNQSLGYITHSEALANNLFYEILVKNVT